MAGASTAAKKPLHITMMSPLPPHKIKSVANWGGRIIFNRAEFHNWKAKSALGMRNTIFEINKFAPDYTPMIEFYDTKFHNVEEDAMGYIYDPPQKWAIIKDCGAWPCTGPQNAMFWFKDSTFSGIRPSFVARHFQIISNNEGFSPHVPTCEK